MVKSAEIRNLAAALTKFQADMKPVTKEADNPFFKSKYADLASIIEAIRKPLSDQGLAYAQFPTGENQLTTVLMHTSGEWIEDTFTMRSNDLKPQTVGSLITYMRRYALSSILGIATELDDDGNAASGIDHTQAGYAPKTVTYPGSKVSRPPKTPDQFQGDKGDIPF